LKLGKHFTNMWTEVWGLCSVLFASCFQYITCLANHVQYGHSTSTSHRTDGRTTHAGITRLPML